MGKRFRKGSKSVEDWTSLCHKALLTASHCMADLRGTILEGGYFCLLGCDCVYWQGVKGEMLRLINALTLTGLPPDALPPRDLQAELWKSHYDFLHTYPHPGMPPYGYKLW